MSTAWKDKVVLITGGSQGLGRAIAEAFGAAGCRLVIVGSRSETAETARAALAAMGFDVLGLAADLRRQADVDLLFTQAIDHFGRLDVLVNCAGRSMRGQILETRPEQFEDLMALNFTALARCTQAAAPHLLKTGGHVVNIGSLASKSAAPWTGAYGATKFAVAAYTQQLRLETRPQGLHVLLVCPGPIARKEPRAYPLEGTENIPDAAKAPGGGARVQGLSPQYVAARILRACERRSPELILPAKARLLFVIQQCAPRLGDWLLGKML
jgi:uncharacterized protein